MESYCPLCGERIDYCSGHPADWRDAMEIVHENLEPDLIEYATKMVQDGTAKWIWDPDVDGVAGLVKPGTRTAYMVVYVEAEDLEVSLEFLDRVLEGKDA